MQISTLFTKRILLQAAVISIVYFIVTIYMMNFELVRDTLLGSYGIGYKATLLLALLGGIWTSINVSSLFIVFLIAILTGINISLLTEKAVMVKSGGNVQFFAGGGSFLGTIGSGCAACGLPVLSLLGFSGSIVYLPFRGVEIGVAALLLLVVSFYFLTRPVKVETCPVKK